MTASPTSNESQTFCDTWNGSSSTRRKQRPRLPLDPSAPAVAHLLRMLPLNRLEPKMRSHRCRRRPTSANGHISAPGIRTRPQFRVEKDPERLVDLHQLVDVGPSHRELDSLPLRGLPNRLRWRSTPQTQKFVVVHSPGWSTSSSTAGLRGPLAFARRPKSATQRSFDDRGTRADGLARVEGSPLVSVLASAVQEMGTIWQHCGWRIGW